MSTRSDIPRLAGSLAVLGTELEAKGKTAYEVLEGWEQGARRAPAPWTDEANGDDPAAEDRRQQQSEAARAAGKHAEFVEALKAIDREVQHLNRLLDMACPPDVSELRNRRTGEFDPQTAMDVLASGWCPSCWSAGIGCVPLSPAEGKGQVRRYSDACRPCGDFRKEHGIDKPKAIVVAHHENRRLAPAEVDRLINAARAAAAPSKKKRKGKKGKRAA